MDKEAFIYTQPGQYIHTNQKFMLTVTGIIYKDGKTDFYQILEKCWRF